MNYSKFPFKKFIHNLYLIFQFLVRKIIKINEQLKVHKPGKSNN